MQSADTTILVKLGIVDYKITEPKVALHTCIICGNTFEAKDLRIVTNGTIAEKHCLGCPSNHSEK